MFGVGSTFDDVCDLAETPSEGLSDVFDYEEPPSLDFMIIFSLIPLIIHMLALFVYYPLLPCCIKKPINSHVVWKSFGYRI